MLLLLFFAWLAARYQKRKLSLRLSYATIVVFLLTSTAYLPNFLARGLEQQYQPLDISSLKEDSNVYIHLLGSGYNHDNRLPATAKLAPVAQGRLMEALRLHRQLKSSILVCSAGSFNGEESQAQVARKAAILLGADSSRIITLDTPTTTKEEAISLAQKTGTSISVIIVTDAMHMPRAIKFFSQQGFHPIAAPTNYKVPQPETMQDLNWLPAIKNIVLMDMLLHEYLGNLKGAL